VLEPRVRRASAVGSRYQATTGGEDKGDREDLVRTVVNCRVCELVIPLQLFVVTRCVYKGAINPITNSNPVCSHFHTCDNTILADRLIRVADIRTDLEVIGRESMDFMKVVQDRLQFNILLKL
jgi:hypothetical protein